MAEDCNIYGGFTIYAKWGEIQGDLLEQTDLKNALDGKVDKEEGKGLSTNDYTDEEKNKVNSASQKASTAIQGVKGSGTLIEPDSNMVVDVTPANIKAVPITRTINGRALSSDITLFSHGTADPSGGSDGDVYFKHN